ncbi:MAG: alanine racemase [Sphingomonas hengshuiensis]|uniref:Alanine racemase n=1 Tax=Sphingomonas hengshuiensis TaxID=1609977 RepID=A0A2W4Z799_9SPHN|nr:MAG: alanine racemase [Sphingomonas hengshuiensis]
MKSPRSRPSRRITIVDVARHAAVSTKTVSRVLNGEPHVTDAVRDRVREAVRALDYHPNIMAQGLARQRSYLIGLVYENPSPSYGVDLQTGVLDRLRGERYRLVVLPVRSVTEHADEVVGLLRSAAIDGVVLAPPASDSRRILDELVGIGMPFARISPTRFDDIVPGVVVDDVSAAAEVASVVLAQGHRRIGIIKGDPTHAASSARMQGYADAFADAGATIDPALVVDGLFTFDSGFAAARRLLSGPERPTAILAQNDDMAVGALMAAREAGIDVPDDLSIVGFDDSEIARITWPRITTMRQPVFDMAVSATSLLLDQLSGAPVPATIAHEHRLIVRESIAPVPVARG